MMTLIGPVLAVKPAFAQPSEMPQQQLEAKALEALRAQVAEQRKTDPQGALLLLQGFLEKHPDVSYATRNRVLDDQSRVLFDDLKDADRAIAICEIMVKDAKNAIKAGAPEETLVEVQDNEARIFIFSHQAAKAEALLGTPESWSRIKRMTSSTGGSAWVMSNIAANLFLTALHDQNKDDEVVQKVEELMKNDPGLMVGFYQPFAENMPLRLATALIHLEKSEPGLAWAKYAYQQANFDTKSVEESTKQLTTAWLGADDLAAVRAFAKAQQAAPDAAGQTGATPVFPDPANPLTKVKMPETVVQSRPLLLKMAEPLKSQKDYGHQHDLISIYIALEDWKGAMQTAQALWREDPDNAQGAMEVCRVFKAADLSLVRANQFLAYLQGNGEGTSPFKQFLKEHEADG